MASSSRYVIVWFAHDPTVSEQCLRNANLSPLVTSSIWKERMQTTHGKGHTTHVSNMKLGQSHRRTAYVHVYLDIWYERPHTMSHETTFVKRSTLAMKRTVSFKPLLTYICIHSCVWVCKFQVSIPLLSRKWDSGPVCPSWRSTTLSSQHPSQSSFDSLQDSLKEELEPTPCSMSRQKVSFQYHQTCWFSFALGTWTRQPPIHSNWCILWKSVYGGATPAYGHCFFWKFGGRTHIA